MARSEAGSQEGFDGIHLENHTSLKLQPLELWWRDRQVWLQEQGYMLRPRYHPNWVPTSGNTPDIFSKNEDSIDLKFSQIMDATMMSTGKVVMLKKIIKERHPYEVEIHRFFSTEPLASHPKNHCVPLLDVLEPPDDPRISLIVIPLLRPFGEPFFQTVGEMVEFFRQIFEGIQFMHQCHIAHRDCNSMNIMMDPSRIYPESFHPQATRMDPTNKRHAKHGSRTKTPVKYFLIDFGISVRFSPDDNNPSALPIRGGDKSVPEMQDCTGPLNPFPTDVYYLGNMIREDILRDTYGAEFMIPLMNDMVQDDPSKRPTIDDVVTRFEEIRRSLGWWKLRSRIVFNVEDEVFGVRTLRDISHIFHTIGDILLRRKAIPVPE